MSSRGRKYVIVLIILLMVGYASHEVNVYKFSTSLSALSSLTEKKSTASASKNLTVHVHADVHDDGHVYPYATTLANNTDGSKEAASPNNTFSISDPAPNTSTRSNVTSTTSTSTSTSKTIQQAIQPVQPPVTAIGNASVKFIHRFCQENVTDGTYLFDSPRLLYAKDLDQRDAWWATECFDKMNNAELVNASLHRRIFSHTGKNMSTEEFHNLTKATRDDILGDWRIILFDYKDMASMGFIRAVMEEMSNIIGLDRLYLATRSTTERRNIGNRHAKAENYKRMYAPKFLGDRHNFTTDFVGQVCNGVKRFHFCVRDDVLNALQEDLILYANETGLPTPIDPVDLPRLKDAAHFWDPNVSKKAIVRSKVSKVLKLMEEVYPDRNLTIHADLVGNRGKQGRTGVHHDYTQAMMQFKIIVLAQRDRYEDHYRLFEALISGAMVMSDQALEFPWGVVHGETIVVYNDLYDMQEKVLYYLDHPDERLRIARAGRRLALDHHRVWHRYSDLILGDWTKRNKYGVSLLSP